MRVLTVILLAATLCACGDRNEPASEANAEPKQVTAGKDDLDDSAAEYRAKVQKKTRDSVVNSLAREWEVPEDKVRCVLGQLKLYQIEEASTDPAVQAVFKECGVDPAVVN